MFVTYKCFAKYFQGYYTRQSGSGLNYYQVSALEKWCGFGGQFRSLFHAAVHLLKLGAKAIGKQLFPTEVDVINNVSRGENVDVATQRRLKEACNHLTDQIATKIKAMIGCGQSNLVKELD